MMKGFFASLRFYYSNNSSKIEWHKCPSFFLCLTLVLKPFYKIFCLPICKFVSLGFLLHSLALSFFLSVSVLISINKLCVCDIFSGGPLYMDTQMKGSTVLIISKHSLHMYYVRNLTGQGYFKINYDSIKQ